MALNLEEQGKARRKALQLLEHMDRTEKELTERLRRAGFSPEASEDAVNYMKSFGYVNDARYAQHYISYRLGIKSKQMILLELSRKGVDRGTALAAWEEAAEMEDVDESAVIRRIVEKKYEPGTRLGEKEMRRLYGYLARRGFQRGDISSVLEEMDVTVEREKY